MENQKPTRDTQRDKTILGFFFGCVIATCISIFGLKTLSIGIQNLFIGFISMTVLLSLVFFLVARYKDRILEKTIGISGKEVQELQISIKNIVSKIIDRDSEGIKKSAHNIIQKATTIFAWQSYKILVIRIFYTLFIGFAGLFGSVLIFNQNKLIENQNDLLLNQNDLFKKQNIFVENQTELIKIQNKLIDQQNFRLDQQTNLVEANRRSSLVFLFSNVLDAIDQELVADRGKPNVRDLSDQLIARIIALANNLKPYQYLEKDQLISSPISPERGQILQNLIESNLDNDTYKKIYSKSNFQYSDLQNVNLEFKNLRFLDLRHSNFANSALIGCDFTNAKLDNCSFSNSILDFSIFTGATVTGADLSESSMDNVFWGDMHYSERVSKTIFENTTFPKESNTWHLSEDYLYKEDYYEAVSPNIKLNDHTFSNEFEHSSFFKAFYQLSTKDKEAFVPEYNLLDIFALKGDGHKKIITRAFQSNNEGGINYGTSFLMLDLFKNEKVGKYITKIPAEGRYFTTIDSVKLNNTNSFVKLKVRMNPKPLKADEEYEEFLNATIMDTYPGYVNMVLENGKLFFLLEYKGKYIYRNQSFVSVIKYINKNYYKFAKET